MPEETPPPTPAHHYICLPYINLGDMEKIDLGFATIWNFSRKAEEYIPDVPLQEQVARTLKSYRASYPYPHSGTDIYHPINGIGMIDVGIESKNELDKESRQKANDARLMVFISFLARNNTITRNSNTGHSMASSENFAPVHFSVVVGSQYITEYNGFVVPSWHGGIDIDKNMVVRARHVPTPRFNVEADMLNALIRLRQRKKRVFRKVVSAIEVFYESYYNSTEVSRNARILLQASAFEILLNSNSGNGREILKTFLKDNANYPDDRVLSYKSERRNGRMVSERGTVREKWADRFFTLRNHIIHGHVPKEKEYSFSDWQSHFDIALYFFVFCLKRKIEEHLDREIFGDDVDWKTWEDDLQVPPKTFTGFVYEHYGRRGWERATRGLRP